MIYQKKSDVRGAEYMKQGLIAPSMMCVDFSEMTSVIEAFEKNGIGYLHIDIMDGNFVSNLSFGANVVKALRPQSKMVFDVHLMVNNPENWVEDFIKAGADIVGVHYEATPHIHRALDLIKKNNAKAEVVINPGTPVSAIESVLSIVDQVLVMTVDPGFGGQKFIPETLEKIRQLHQIKEERNLNFDIEVDGGINEETVKLCREAGATVAVAGSYVFNSGNETHAERINKLRN